MVPTLGSQNVTFWYQKKIITRKEERRYGSLAWVRKCDVLVSTFARMKERRYGSQAWVRKCDVLVPTLARMGGDVMVPWVGSENLTFWYPT